MANEVTAAEMVEDVDYESQGWWAITRKGAIVVGESGRGRIYCSLAEALSAAVGFGSMVQVERLFVDEFREGAVYVDQPVKAATGGE